MTASVIIGCGDVGRRIARQIGDSDSYSDIIGLVNSDASDHACAALGVSVKRFDLDALHVDLTLCDEAEIYYTVAPQKKGLMDLRTRSLLEYFSDKKITPAKAIVISTTVGTGLTN